MTASKQISKTTIQIIDGDRGKNYPKQSEFFENGYCLFLNTGNVSKEGFVFSNCMFITKDKDQKLRKGKLLRNDIVLTTRGTVGNLGHYSCSIPFDVIRINSGMVIIRSDESEYDSKFLYYIFRSQFMQEQFQLFSSGTAQPQLPIKDFKRISIPIVEAPIQKRIAAILSAYDDLIEVNNQRIKLLEETARELYKEWFVRMRFPGYKKAKFVKGVPEGWEVKSVSDIAEVTSSKRIFLSDYVSEGIPFYRGKEISMKSNNEEVGDILYITHTKFAEIKKRFGVPVNGDILITAVGTIGNIYLVNETDGDFYFKDGNLIWLRKFKSKELSFYFYYYSISDVFTNSLSSITIGSSQEALTIASLKKIKLFLPSQHLIEMFYQLTDPIKKQLNILQQQNTQLRQIRDRLLPRLVSGKLAVKI